jgi:N-acyl-D-aspartate/D-glutamate deacylase
MADNRYDLVIRGGTVLDGMGTPGFVADVAIRSGYITEIGRITASGREEIDARGQIVTPGFVDIHTHYDGQATWTNYMSPSSHHGVTTAVMGNCGVGFAPCKPNEHDLLIKLMDGVEDIPDVVLAAGVPWKWESFPEYLNFLAARKFDIDLGAYIPHAAVRVYVMGERGLNCEPANADDIALMGRLVKEAVLVGALGFGTSRVLFHQTRDGKPIPTLKSSADELLGLAQAMGEVNTGIVQYVGLFEDPKATFDELRNLVEKSGRPLTFPAGPGIPEGMQFIAKARADGFNVTGQLSPRATSFMISHEMTLHPFCATAPYKALAHLSFDEKIAELRKPEVRAAILNAEFRPNPGSLSSMMRRFDRIFVLGDPPNYEPSPRDSMAAMATRRGIRPEELTYDLMLEKNGRNLLYGALTGYDTGSLEGNVNAFTQSGMVPALGDGGAHCATICDASYSTFMLQYMARDRKGTKLPLEHVVKALTSGTADVVGFKDRARVACGYRADLNVIDFDRLKLHPPHLVWDLPAGGKRLLQNADGYTATIKNGEVTYRNGAATGALPGRLVRGVQPRPNA